MRAVRPIKIADLSLAETSFIRRTFAQIWEEMAVLLCGSLLVALSALPVALLVVGTGWRPLLALGLFTVVPAWVACCSMAGQASVSRKPRLSDFWAAFVGFYWQSCLLVLPVAALLVIVLISLPMLAGPSLPVVAGAAFALVTFAVALMIVIFAAPILSLFQVDVRQAWAYGLVLALRNPLVAPGLLALGVLLVPAAERLGLGIWLIIPLVFIPFEVNTTLVMVKKTVELERASSAELQDSRTATSRLSPHSSAERTE